jgi:hypothetical protein
MPSSLSLFHCCYHFRHFSKKNPGKIELARFSLSQIAKFVRVISCSSVFCLTRCGDWIHISNSSGFHLTNSDKIAPVPFSSFSTYPIKHIVADIRLTHPAKSNSFPTPAYCASNLPCAEWYSYRSNYKSRWQKEVYYPRYSCVPNLPRIAL